MTMQPFDPNEQRRNVPQCSGKRPYATIVEASRAANAIGKRSPRGSKTQAYYCEGCRNYHFGRQRQVNKPSKWWR